MRLKLIWIEDVDEWDDFHVGFVIWAMQIFEVLYLGRYTAWLSYLLHIFPYGF